MLVRRVTAITVAPGGYVGAGVRAGLSPGGAGASVNGGFGATNGQKECLYYTQASEAPTFLRIFLRTAP